jgi:uncharacterized membrane-anchored protein YitT (DUF2179 family)
MYEQIKKIAIVSIGALLNAVGLNLFLIPADVYASGFTGVAQLLSGVLDEHSPIYLSTGVLLFLLNIPVGILGWMKVGKSFTFYSTVSVILTTLFLILLPEARFSEDILLNAVFGGVISAIGIGITLKYGASTGGLDIIAMVLAKWKDKPVGTYFFILNAIIILTAGALNGAEKALYTLVTLYVTTRVIDTIHTRHEKLTVMIVTKKSDLLKKAIYSRMKRGITTVPAKGAFTNEEKDMMIIVITRYELYYLEKIISEVDPDAFTNIIQTTGVLGLFNKD